MSQLVCISALSTGREVCPRLSQSVSTGTTHTRYSWLQQVRLLRSDKGSNVQRSVVARQRSKCLDGGLSEDSLRRATRIRAFPRNAIMDRKEFKAERNVNWPCIPAVISEEQWYICSIVKTFCFSPAKTFSVAISAALQLACNCRCLCFLRVGWEWPSRWFFCQRQVRSISTYFFGNYNKHIRTKI